ncbi:MAG: DHHA1 domain-containing protein [Candidatus Brocadiia bacterium]
MSRPELPSSREQAEQLCDLLSDRERALLMLHNNPDPDAMAGGLCLCHLIEQTTECKPRIVYGGIVGRAENRHMVRALEIPLWSVDNIKIRPEDAVVMVDTQPGFGNNSAPGDCDVVAVIDHHPPLDELDVPFVDVREGYGAVTTILTEYLVGAGVSVPSDLATAICYGISSETQDLGREASEADIAAFLEVFPASDQPLLGRLHHPTRPVAFFGDLGRALHAAQVAGDVLVCHMQGASSADAVAEMADMLISVEGVHWALCSAPYGERLVLSLRSARRDARAGELLREVVGEPGLAGGHGMIAGGAIPLEAEGDADPLRRELTESLLETLGRDPEQDMNPLVPQGMLPEAEGAGGIV